MVVVAVVVVEGVVVGEVEVVVIVADVEVSGSYFNCVC